jgi:hypothetical protein
LAKNLGLPQILLILLNGGDVAEAAHAMSILCQMRKRNEARSYLRVAAITRKVHLARLRGIGQHFWWCTDALS